MVEQETQMWPLAPFRVAASEPLGYSERMLIFGVCADAVWWLGLLDTAPQLGRLVARETSHVTRGLDLAAPLPPPGSRVMATDFVTNGRCFNQPTERRLRKEPEPKVFGELWVW